MKGAYNSESRATQYRKKDEAKELEKEASQSYQIGTLWQQNCDLGIISASRAESTPSAPLDPVDNLFSFHLLSQILQGLKISESKREIRIEQRKEAFQVLSRLLQLVTEQEKVYGERLSLYSNFYLRHTMVLQFLQAQLTDKTSQT